MSRHRKFSVIFWEIIFISNPSGINKHFFLQKKSQTKPQMKYTQKFSETKQKMNLINLKQNIFIPTTNLTIYKPNCRIHGGISDFLQIPIYT